MSRIFISYRRADSAADMTDRIYERLVRRWGRRVFMDIDSLAGGDLFAKTIDDNLESCVVVLVVLGRQWASLTDDNGERRIDDPADYPRMEVAAALRRGIRVIPVLVGDATLPRSEELPADIAGLVERQVVRVSRERFEADLRELIDDVALDMPRNPWWWPPWWGWAAAGLAGVAVLVAFLVFERMPSPQRQAEADASGPARSEEPLAAARLEPTAGPAMGTASAPAVVSSGVAPAETATSVRAAATPANQPRGVVAARSSPPARPAQASTTSARAAAANTAATLTGDWLSSTFESAYSSHRYTLLFEFVQQDELILGTVVDVSNPDRRFGRPIVDGRIKGDVLSFHTEGELCCNKDGSYSRYKTTYVGTLTQGTRRIDFRRYDDVSSGGQTERFSARPKD